MLRAWLAREKSLSEAVSDWLAARSRAEVLFIVAFYVVQSTSEQLLTSLLWRASTTLFRFWQSRPRRYVLLLLLVQITVVLYVVVEIGKITKILKEFHILVEKRQEHMVPRTAETETTATSDTECYEEGPR